VGKSSPRRTAFGCVYSGASMPADFPIESRFVLHDLIGRGASGDVHRATDRETGSVVAVKRLAAGGDEPILVDRFRREAKLLAQIDHPNVVRYVAHGVDSRGRLCLVVEWLAGEDLARRLKRESPSIAEALDIARQTANGLHALHLAGIVHRDVKPSNLYLSPRADGSVHVKIIDLGVARSATESTLTTSGSTIGTPFYMAPEQARGEDRITSRADQFAFGAVLFELLARRRAFTGDDVFAVLAKIVLGDPPPLREALPTAPAELCLLVDRAMSKAPDDRFASMSEIAERLATIAAWSPAEARTAITGPPKSLPNKPNTALGDDEDEAATRVGAMTTASERRVVTALFAGFLPSKNDADLATFEALAAEHGAATSRTLGRRVIAVFGATRTRGDEVVRAARAAIAASERVFGIRLAIATGRALSGLGGLSGELIERGVQVVERGARRPGGAWPIRIDEATAQSLEEHFVVEGPPDARVLAAYRPTAATPRTLIGKVTPCVGRDRELAILAATFDECASEPVARALLVTGVAGIGKSRLRHEMLARLAHHEADPVTLLARGTPLAEASPFGLLATALRKLAGIGGGEPPALQRRKLSERLGRVAPQHVIDPLAELAWLQTGETKHGDARPLDAMVMGDRIRVAWIEWLTAETVDRSVAIVIEDLHWGDLASVQLLDAALRALEARPLFVVALARPEVHERFPSLWSSRGLQEIRLGPLTPKATSRLARAALGERATDATIQRIVDRGEGNAFYIEELIRAAAEGAAESLPDSVLGMVQGRLDALGSELKMVLRAASVFGETFWRGGVADLAVEVRDLSTALARLVALEIVSPRPTSVFPGDEEYVFRHALVREAAYAMIPDRERCAAHRTVGAWLQRSGEADAALLGAHFERGQDLARAAGFLLRAARSAVSGNDFAGAIALAQRSMDLDASADGPTDDRATRDRRGQALLVQAEAHRWSTSLDRAAATGAEASRLLPRGSTLWFRAMRETIAALGRLGRADRAAELTEEALQEEPAPDAIGARLACLGPAAAYLFYAGDLDGGERLLARINEIERAAPSGLDPSVTARLHQLRSLRADLRGAMEEAVAHQVSAIADFERAGDLRGACQSLANAGYMQSKLGDFEAAGEALRRAREGAQRMGLAALIALADHNLGVVLAALGRLDEAMATERSAIEAFRRSNDVRMENASRIYLARMLLAAGDTSAAEIEARLAADHPASPGPVRAGGLSAVALALLAAGRPAEALAPASAAAALLVELGAMEDFEIQIGIAHAEALAANGDMDAAMRAIAETRRRVQRRAVGLGEATRRLFLEAVPDNALCVGLAVLWGAPDTG